MSDTKRTKRTAGRPEGSANVKLDQVVVCLSRCKKCDSTDRDPYFGTPFELEYSGEHDGKPYTHVVQKRTRCKSCGQHRRDISYENRR